MCFRGQDLKSRGTGAALQLCSSVSVCEWVGGDRSPVRAWPYWVNVK